MNKKKTDIFRRDKPGPQSLSECNIFYLQDSIHEKKVMGNYSMIQYPINDVVTKTIHVLLHKWQAHITLYHLIENNSHLQQQIKRFCFLFHMNLMWLFYLIPCDCPVLNVPIQQHVTDTILLDRRALRLRGPALFSPRVVKLKTRPTFKVADCLICVLQL